MQHPMTRPALVLLLVTLILTLPPLAYDGAPAPRGQAGFFDDDNVDDVIGSIISVTGPAVYQPVPCLLPRRTLVLLGDSPEIDPVPFVPLPSSDPRAPPTL